MGVRILVGHVIDQLRSLPDESVHMVVTSPPYFGLRSYSTPPTVWGGDPDCQHRWGDVGRAHHPGQVPDGKSVHKENSSGQTAGSGRFCALCSAWNGDLGLEPSPALFIEHLVVVFREVRRVLRRDGTVFLNLGDSYAGSWGSQGHRETPATLSRNQIKNHPKKASHTGAIREAGLKPKDMMMIPARVAIALQEDGWYLRSDIIWSKLNPMPESVTDRPTTAHEHVFLLSRNPSYFYDAEAIKEAAVGETEHDLTGAGYAAPGQTAQRGSRGRAAGNKSHKYVTEYEASETEEHRTKAGLLKIAGTAYPTRNKRSVWTIATSPYPEAHFATFPPGLVEPCIMAGTSAYGVCGKCGGPWERAVEKTRTFESGSGRAGNMPVGKNGPDLQGGGATLDIRRGPCVSAETTGWQPTCSCGPDAGIKPAVVCDPFFGAGTTGLVADRLKRDCIGIELNPAYARMAEARLRADAGMFANITTDGCAVTKAVTLNTDESKNIRYSHG